MDLIAGLPPELREVVFRFAGPLTQYLHRRLVLPITWMQLRLVIADCFKQDRVDIVRCLPTLGAKAMLDFEFLFIKSEEMKQVAQRLPRDEYVYLYTELNFDEKPTSSVLQECWNAARSGLPAELRGSFAELLNRIHTKVRPPFHQKFADRLLDCAAAVGNIRVAADLLPYARGVHPIYTAALHRNLEFVKFLCEHRVADDRALAGAVAGGSCEIAEFLVSIDASLEFDQESIEMALAMRRLDVVWWLIRDPTRQHHPAFGEFKSRCAEYGCLELLEYAVLHRIGAPLSIETMCNAVSNGHQRFDLAVF
eukprot:jgi/Hompol1/6400/HPOL_000856-RA